MESVVERYAWLVAYERKEAQHATTLDERRRHEQLARLFMLKLQELEGHSEPPRNDLPPSASSA